MSFFYHEASESFVLDCHNGRFEWPEDARPIIYAEGRFYVFEGLYRDIEFFSRREILRVHLHCHEVGWHKDPNRRNYPYKPRAEFHFSDCSIMPPKMIPPGQENIVDRPERGVLVIKHPRENTLDQLKDLQQAWLRKHLWDYPGSPRYDRHRTLEAQWEFFRIVEKYANKYSTPISKGAEPTNKTPDPRRLLSFAREVCHSRDPLKATLLWLHADKHGETIVHDYLSQHGYVRDHTSFFPVYEMLRALFE